MIVFDLKCTNDHVFEGWFRDSKTFERQAKKSQVVCPTCGDTGVEKALMAPNITASRTKAAAETQKAREAMAMLSQLRNHVERNFDYVGADFAEEARKIHHGESEQREIYGEASDDDATSLNEEGIKVAKIPWLPRADN